MTADCSDWIERARFAQFPNSFPHELLSMSKSLISPVLFSSYFKVDPNLLRNEGLFDPILNADSKIFIDPLLIQTSENPHMPKAYEELKKHFSDIVRLVAISDKVDDVAWKAASKLLDLKERPETCLGYGGTSISGSSRSKELLDRILTTISEIIRLGEKDPEMISLMGAFEEGVGPDTISDLTTNAIMEPLALMTSEFCKAASVPVVKFDRYQNLELPENPYRQGMPVILVPRDIVRDLPLAADWADVSRVTFENKEIREQFNSYFGTIAKATVTEKKDALRRTALSSLENFRAIMSAIIGSSDSYDPDADPLGIYAFRELLYSKPDSFKSADGHSELAPSQESLETIVNAVISHFRQLIEQNNLWELLWDKSNPKRERASQLVFFAVADMFCKANNIDINPESNAGGGPVDFKFSKGYANRIIVEVKLSKGAVVHGYKTQLPIYQSAAQTDNAVMLVVNVGKMGSKLRDITALHDAALAAGKKAPAIEVVDGRRRKSASVREGLEAVIEDDVSEDEQADEDDEG